MARTRASRDSSNAGNSNPSGLWRPVNSQGCLHVRARVVRVVGLANQFGERFRRVALHLPKHGDAVRWIEIREPWRASRDFAGPQRAKHRTTQFGTLGKETVNRQRRAQRPRGRQTAEGRNKLILNHDQPNRIPSA